jgi:hypothetical protein
MRHAVSTRVEAEAVPYEPEVTTLVRYRRLGPGVAGEAELSSPDHADCGESAVLRPFLCGLSLLLAEGHSSPA